MSKPNSKSSETQDDFDWLNEDDDRFTATMWEQSDGSWLVKSEGSQYDSFFTKRFADSVDANIYMDKVNRGELDKQNLYDDEMNGYRSLESKASELFGQNDPSEILGGTFGTPEDTANDLYNMTSHDYSHEEYDKWDNKIIDMLGQGEPQFDPSSLDSWLRSNGVSEDLIYDLIREWGRGTRKVGESKASEFTSDDRLSNIWNSMDTNQKSDVLEYFEDSDEFVGNNVDNDFYSIARKLGIASDKFKEDVEEFDYLINDWNPLHESLANEKEQWITMSGNHILVKDGQTKKQAVSDFLDNVDDDLKSSKKDEPKGKSKGKKADKPKKDDKPKEGKSWHEDKDLEDLMDMADLQGISYNEPTSKMEDDDVGNTNEIEPSEEEKEEFRDKLIDDLNAGVPRKEDVSEGFYDGKTFTCDKCGKVGDSFTDMAQEECPADVNANHQIPIFGDMKTESKASEVGTWADIERDEGQSMSLLARNVWIEDHFNELSSEDFTRLADDASNNIEPDWTQTATVYGAPESKASENWEDEGEITHDNVGFFPDRWVCKHCGKELELDGFFHAGFSINLVTNDGDILAHLAEDHGINESKASEYLVQEEFDLQDQDGKYEMLSKADLSVTDAIKYSTYSHDELPEEVKDSLKGDEDSFGESWNQKSSINRIESLESVGIKQGDAIKLSGLEFEDFGEDLQGALKGDVEDARREMKSDKDTLDKTDPLEPSYSFQWQEGGEVDNPNSEFDQNYPDYNNIGESQTIRTNYECEFCDNGFTSNEALSIHHNDKHAIAPESLDGYDYAEKPYWSKLQDRTLIHKNFDPIWGSPIDEDGNVHDRANDDDLHEYGNPESSEGDSLKCSHCGQIFNPDNEQVLYSHLAGHGITESKATEIQPEDLGTWWDSRVSGINKKTGGFSDKLNASILGGATDDDINQNWSTNWDDTDTSMKQKLLNQISDQPTTAYGGIESKANEDMYSDMSLSEFLGQWGFTMDDAKNVAERLGISNLEELKNLGDDFFYHANNYNEEMRWLKQEADWEFKTMEQERIKRGMSTDDYYKLSESKANEDITFADTTPRTSIQKDMIEFIRGRGGSASELDIDRKFDLLNNFDNESRHLQALVNDGTLTQGGWQPDNSGNDGYPDGSYLYNLNESYSSEEYDIHSGDEILATLWKEWKASRSGAFRNFGNWENFVEEDNSDRIQGIKLSGNGFGEQQIWNWWESKNGMRLSESKASESDVSFGTLIDYLGIDYSDGSDYCKICGKDLTHANDNELLNHVNSHDDKTLLEGESKATEAGSEDHVCAECGFVTSDNSEYIDHLNSHEV